MAGELVLITGVSGHVGFAVLRHALEHGYKVRGAVRSQAKADTVRSNAALGDIKDDQLSFIIVPDMVAIGAFDEAVKDVQYIIHCASPLPFAAATTDRAREDYIEPAAEATLAMFRSAAKEKSVKRVVVTSSVIAVVPMAAVGVDTGETFTADTRQPEPEGSFGLGTPSFVAYAASKVNALNQAETWMKENKRQFDVIHLMPSFVVGRNDLCESAESLRSSSNNFVLSIVAAAGTAEGAPPGMAMVINHIDDCARIHVEALDPKVEGDQSFVISDYSKPGPQWNDAKAIVERRFPEAVKAGILPNGGGLESVSSSIDSAKTEKTFGLKHTYEDAVADLVEQYLQLSGRAYA